MKFIMKKEHLEIKFSWKEIFFIVIRGHFKMDNYSIYKFANILTSIFHTMLEKYGDASKHGTIDMDQFKDPHEKEE